MKIELELHLDQDGINEEDILSSTWIFRLNDKEFPSASVCTLDQAHKMACRMCDLEAEIYMEAQNEETAN